MAQDVTPQLPTLAELESVVEENLGAVNRTVVALSEIKERRLYRVTHASFEEYAYDRFGISLSTAKRWTALGDELRRERLAITAGADANPQVSVGRARPIPTQRGAVARRKEAREATAKPARTPKPPKVIEAAAEEVPNATLDIEPPPESTATAPPPVDPPPPPPGVSRRVQSVYETFDPFFASDPAAVAALSDYQEGRARLRKARQWVDGYEMAVKGVTPAARTPTSTPSRTPAARKAPAGTSTPRGSAGPAGGREVTTMFKTPKGKP